MAIIKAFEFDGEISSDYGVQILGEGVFNAPEREVEMISIPGRNGAFALDKGRFENIEVTYPANIIANSTADFAAAVSDLRNMLCSRRGYCRLTDDYHPDEYRMAVYKSGLEVDEKVLRAGEFEIVFDCKPQRYLMSGEVPIDVSSGDTILGPTLFDSHPMLEVTGYGEIGINGEVVAINDAVLGQTKISTRTDGKSVTLDVSNLNEGDLIYKLDTDKPVLEYGMKPKSGTFGTAEITSVSNCTAYISGGSTKQKIIVVPDFPQIAQGTSVTVNASVSLTLVVGGVTYNGTITVPLSYNGSTNVISMNVSRSDMPSTSDVTYDSYYQHPAYYSDSTKLVYPAPMYIDLDIGEAYGVVNDEVLSFNNIVSMPAELPVLKPGSNTITFDNTVTDLKIVPRWWKI